MWIRKIARSSHLCQPVHWPKSSRLLLLPWYTAITGYHTSRKNNYNQWLATLKQEICYWVQLNQSRREKSTANGRYLWQFKYVSAIPLCVSNGLISGYITSIHDKRIVTSYTTWHLMQTIRVFQLLLLCSILSADNIAVIYATGNLQLMIYS